MDILRGMYTKKGYFLREFEAAKERLKPLGGEVIPGDKDYEAFIYIAEGIRLTFYPHKTSKTGNRHIRFRSSNNSDPKKVKDAVFALAENSCNFQYPTNPTMHRDAVNHALKIGRVCA